MFLDMGTSQDINAAFREQEPKDALDSSVLVLTAGNRILWFFFFEKKKYIKSVDVFFFFKKKPKKIIFQFYYFSFVRTHI